ncbi:hypothetical protein HMPREF0972_00797 [Actinomyces sp. oral taxon 848 str. F0332]|nr:hypothetical protein HMPREF0972_00797 [Actinomyces sp. oral taxon 848 str. F0332]
MLLRRAGTYTGKRAPAPTMGWLHRLGCLRRQLQKEPIKRGPHRSGPLHEGHRT